ncbi:hypothetical protein [Eubacterium oxidoreducens]|uniref:Uncharacterized protein n=1 Tax=Eubacterium oxidoreducens TaxID=1732 RepID=A0A1G6AG58_EUBOX|nr:hypothetical protein [Eubacterium oxidoreducens]SDB07073.1 hypothetical protein SAMN02910417_00514 [Eubacterium oxidoreducens]
MKKWNYYSTKERYKREGYFVELDICSKQGTQKPVYKIGPFKRSEKMYLNTFLGILEDVVRLSYSEDMNISYSEHVPGFGQWFIGMDERSVNPDLAVHYEDDVLEVIKRLNIDWGMSDDVILDFKVTYYNSIEQKFYQVG